MTTEELTQDFRTHNGLYHNLWDICNNYVEKNHIRENEQFDDFFMVDADTIGLTFVDCSGDHSGIYTSVKIKDLID